MAEEDRGSLIVIIIDTSPSLQSFKDGESVVVRCLDAIVTFANSHLMMNPLNKLAVISCHMQSSCFLYPQPKTDDHEDMRPHDGQYELFSDVKTCIETKLKDHILNSPLDNVSCESLMAGAMSMALCYIHRIQKEEITGTKIPSRILTITASGDNASQYMNFMNVFFTSQKEGVVIDACIIEKDSGLLQQGCDITGGIYLKIPNIGALLQYMLWVFLPGEETRQHMILPPRIHVDYRAACFCHRNLIEIGYVCSVCLSIFCTFSPICSTCQTAFKLGLLPPIVSKKRKKHAC